MPSQHLIGKDLDVLIMPTRPHLVVVIV